ncbi:hypothetical protein SBF1_880027 [Candidatus Desulfosporosinus infrequens]|uniref:Uncharacterized protein n=1 Tax=Candidatus Desulfosporosinus infrequens TaxID=2043169 RepID=A0A2U3LVK7_9FIRM|nr:hypothetical protein SBF1_880027 [Candidatus Desulfosporosinus infrequens]
MKFELYLRFITTLKFWFIVKHNKVVCRMNGCKWSESTTQYLPNEDILLWMSFFIEQAYKCNTLVTKEGSVCKNIYANGCSILGLTY